MQDSELGHFVCVAHGGCLHSPHRTITTEGVWVRSPDPDPLLPDSFIYSSAHQDCYQAWKARERLEYLRGEIRAERISYKELAELQFLAPYIEGGDTELAQWAGIPEDEFRER